jgi:hypothetical protein
MKRAWNSSAFFGIIFFLASQTAVASKIWKLGKVVIRVESNTFQNDDKAKNENNDVSGRTRSKNSQKDIEKIRDTAENEETSDSLCDAKIIKNDKKHEVQPDKHDHPYTLGDIRSEIKKLENSKKFDPELAKKLKTILQKDMNDFLCRSLTKEKLPHGKVFAFQDGDSKAKDGKWYGLVTSGARREWTLLTPEGEQFDGDVSIEESSKSDENEIVFRRSKDQQFLKSADWIFVTPKNPTVIKEIRSFKKHLKLSSEELKKFQRAAYISTDENGWQFTGYHEIESNQTEYDDNTTMYKIEWHDHHESDTLKHKSDLIAGELDIGDRVIYDGNFGIVKAKFGIQCVDRMIYDYQVELEDDPYNRERKARGLTSDKLALWEKVNKRKRKDRHKE